MDSHAIEFYSTYSDKNPHGHFHKVISLHNRRDLTWEAVKKMAPHLCRGWFELSHLPTKDRIDFTFEFWLTKLPYHPLLNKFLDIFFNSIDDIAIFLTQAHDNELFEAQLVYSLSENSGFFHGYPPAMEEEILALQKDFPDYILPNDYLSFLRIHNGFAKLTDTGIMKSEDMKTTYENFQKMLKNEDPIITSSGNTVNPASLIPFYKSFGMPFFQCFWGEWYHENEMGNVYYSGVSKTISDCTKTDFHVETMAFETFIDWLIFYLEKIN